MQLSGQRCHSQRGSARRQANKHALFAAIGDLLSGFQGL